MVYRVEPGIPSHIWETLFKMRDNIRFCWVFFCSNWRFLSHQLWKGGENSFNLLWSFHLNNDHFPIINIRHQRIHCLVFVNDQKEHYPKTFYRQFDQSIIEIFAMKQLVIYYQNGCHKQSKLWILVD